MRKYKVIAHDKNMIQRAQTIKATDEADAVERCRYKPENVIAVEPVDEPEAVES